MVGTLALILIGALIVGKQARLCAFLATLGVVVAGLLNWRVWTLLADGGAQGAMEPTAGAPMLIADNFTVFFKFFLLFFLLAVTALWLIGSADRETDAPEFFILLLGSALGMSLMVSTLNLLLIIIAIELASLPSYAIVAFDKRSRLGAEGSIKYMIFGSASAGVMLYGASILYGLFGTLDLSVMAPKVLDALQAGENTMLFAIALVAFFVGIAFKISAVPVHFWCPDAFQGAKTEVTTWLSVASKAAGLCLLLRIMHTLASAAVGRADQESSFEVLQPITIGIGIFAAITCFVGNLAAYRQTSVKRMLAYSSIAHAGYILMLGAIVLRPESSEAAWTALIFYMLMYLFMNLGVFGATALVEWQTGSDSIENFNGLGRRSPALAVGMTVCLFSLIGMPPLGGFFAKWWLLLALAEPGGWLWALIIWASLNTAFSLFYYLRIIKHMYMIDDERPKLNAPLSGVLIVNICALVLLLSGTIMVSGIKSQARRYATGLFGAPPARVTDTGAKQDVLADPHEFAESQ